MVEQEASEATDQIRQSASQEVEESLLQLWWNAASENEDGSYLARLLTEQAEPIIRTIVHRKFGGLCDPFAQSDTEDLINEIIFRLLKFLRRIKASGQWQALPKDFRSYAATLSYHSCAEYFRQRFPQRRRLKDQLRYVLTHYPEFALWLNDLAHWLCGFAEWEKNSDCISEIPLLKAPLENIHLLFSIESDRQLVDRHLPLPQLLRRLFSFTAKPVLFKMLLNFVSTIQGVQDPQAVSVDSVTEMPQPHPWNSNHFSGEEVRLSQQLFLKEIWGQIIRMSLPHRMALLLNLHDAGDKGLITLLSDLRIVSLPELAAALELSPEDFAELWNELPLDDMRIASLLNVSRQQVINLRKAARKQLSAQLG